MADPKHTRVRPNTTLRQMPNIGPAMEGDFALLGIAQPADLVGRDAFELHAQLCRITRQEHDPCVIDTFMAAIDFAEGAPARPWFAYTERRKALLAGSLKRPRSTGLGRYSSR